MVFRATIYGISLIFLKIVKDSKENTDIPQ